MLVVEKLLARYVKVLVSKLVSIDQGDMVGTIHVFIVVQLANELLTGDDLIDMIDFRCHLVPASVAHQEQDHCTDPCEESDDFNPNPVNCMQLLTGLDAHERFTINLWSISGRIS